jgi:hypothetical protein
VIQAQPSATTSASGTPCARPPPPAGRPRRPPSPFPTLYVPFGPIPPLKPRRRLLPRHRHAVTPRSSSTMTSPHSPCQLQADSINKTCLADTAKRSGQEPGRWCVAIQTSTGPLTGPGTVAAAGGARHSARRSYDSTVQNACHENRPAGRFAGHPQLSSTWLRILQRFSGASRPPGLCSPGGRVC